MSSAEVLASLPSVAAVGLAEAVDKLENLAVSEGIIKKQSNKGVPAGRKRRDIIAAKSKDSTPAIEDEEDSEFDAILTELRSSLDAKKQEEDRLQKEINEILASSATEGGSRESRTFERAASKFNNQMVGVESEARRLADSLREVSKLADAISSKVADLDLAKTRVVECLQLAGDMMDLSMCSERVDDAIRGGDWNEAAELVHRFLTLDKAVFQLRDTSDKEAGQSIRTSYEILEKARSRLKEEFARGMDAAVAGGDVAGMHRYLKLFPFINDHDDGLRRLSEYLKKEIARIGQDQIKIMRAGGTDDSRASVLYADTLFLFFDALAALLDTHHPIVLNGYGPDRVLDLVHMVQGEIDTIVVQVIDAFRSARRFDDSVRAVEKAMRGGGGMKEERPDPLQLDVLLSEVSHMHARTELYWRFLKKKMLPAAAAAAAPPKSPTGAMSPRDEEEDEDEITRETRKKAEAERAEERTRKLHALLHKSRVGLGMQELIGRYIPMEAYYVEEMVAKAIGEAQREDKGHTWITSSMVDDTLFLVRKAVRRAVATASSDAAAATVNNAVALLETTFYKALATPIEAGFPSASLFTAEMLGVGGVVPTGGVTSAAKVAEQRETYLCTLNNARVSADLLRQLRAALLKESGAEGTVVPEKMKLASALAQLDDVAKRMEQLASRGCNSVAKVAIRPTIRNSCDQYLERDHELTSDQLAEYESVDPFIESFCVTVDRLLVPFERSLAPDNYQDLLLSTCDECARGLLSALLKCAFNRLGALQLDRELRYLTGYLSGVAGFAAREKCAKLTQIVCVLNVESVDEAKEVWQSGSGVSRSLGSGEFKKILGRRTDLPKTAVQNMELIS
ncbi:cogc-4 [Pristionchus pacificus]|uniref:Conserved oligomeric Golgi complex subunit 4 n=1 Tax=Pristionchus pacificus TaxID=54126 RepID=A0A2A6CZ84_PRIPA|nr:cogc-4 [Pristionchus pacificus]|eukprot:PDM83341.1 cogc-4 [Pristionchus pacificus]